MLGMSSEAEDAGDGGNLAAWMKSLVGRRRQAVSDYPRDGTGIFFLAGEAGCKGTRLACLLAEDVDGRWADGVASFPLKAGQCPTTSLWFGGVHPCWLKLVAKRYCSALLLSLRLLPASCWVAPFSC